MKKIVCVLGFIMLLACCSPLQGKEKEKGITVAAAASLEKIFNDRLLPLFNKEYPDIAVQCVFDSSGRLQAQIENGLGVDVFMSASTKQMDELISSGHIDGGSVVSLLENRIVLIAPSNADTFGNDFKEIMSAKTVALGDPESVPAGQYAKEALSSLGIWDDLSKRASFGANVTEVLAWVAEGSAEMGIVYATDAYLEPRVRIIAEAPVGSLKTAAIYPVGIVSSSAGKDTAQIFIDFLKSPQSLEIFKNCGFVVNI